MLVLIWKIKKKETPNICAHDRVLDADISVELPPVEPTRRSCSASSAPLGSAQASQSARADEASRAGSSVVVVVVVDATLADEEEGQMARSELHGNMKYNVENLDGRELEELVDRRGISVFSHREW